MSAHWGLQLLLSVIREGNIRILSRYKLTRDLFRENEQPLYDYLRAYAEDERHYGLLPPLEVVETYFQHLDLPRIQVDAPIPVLADLLHTDVIKTEMRSSLMELTNSLETDPWGCVQKIREIGYDLNQGHNHLARDSILSRDYRDVIEHFRAMSGGNTMGVNWVWKELTQRAGPAEDRNLIVFIGRPKSEKTHLLILQACFSYLAGLRVLLVNTEMHEMVMRRRIAACMLRLNYLNLIRHLAPEDVDMIEAELASLSDIEVEEQLMAGATLSKTFILTSEVTTTIDLREKILEVEPDVVFVDTASELMPSKQYRKDNERQTQLVREVRALHRGQSPIKAPIIVTIHANRLGDVGFGETYSELAGTDQWGKSADMAVRIIRYRHPASLNYELAMIPVGGTMREGLWEGIVVGAVPYSDMEYKRETSSEEIKELVKLPKEDARGSRAARSMSTSRPIPQSLDGVPWAGPAGGRDGGNR